jgi:DNA primase
LGFALQGLDDKHPYLTERDLTPETIAEFGLGFCAKGSMNGRIVIPIHNGEGKLLAYAGRFPGEPKYKLPAGFKKSAELFNLHRALKEPKEQPLIIVEGFFDVAKLWQHGARKVVALMGSFLSPAQEELITRHAHSVLLMFDEDAAGKLCREQVMLRLCTRLFVKVWPFAKEGDQPDNLSFEDVQKLLAHGRNR